MRRTLTQRHLNRALLARQLLLERSRTTIPRVLERVGCIQAQYAPSMYIGLWSRLEGFERDDLTKALEQRKVVQGTLMRVTIHLASAADYWPLAVAIRKPRRESWLRAHRHNLSGAEVAATAKRVRRKLAAGPLSRREIDPLIGKSSVMMNGIGMWLDLVRVPPSGTWERRRADHYALAEQWVGPEEVTLDDALDHLVRRYLGGFGPSTLNEIADWAGMPPKVVAPACGRLRLRRFEAEDGTELVDLPRAPLPDPETPAPVRFLPNWDATTLVHVRRTGILPEEFRSRVFNTKTPQATATFIVDGAVAGLWSYEKGRVRIKPFRRLDQRTRREVQQEADRLTELHQ